MRPEKNPHFKEAEQPKIEKSAAVARAEEILKAHRVEQDVKLEEGARRLQEDVVAITAQMRRQESMARLLQKAREEALRRCDQLGIKPRHPEQDKYAAPQESEKPRWRI